MFLKYMIQKLCKYKKKFTSIRCIQSESNPGKCINVLFFGTDNFSLPSLEKLLQEKQNSSTIKSLGVVTSFKSPFNPVKRFVDKHRLTCYEWPVRTEDCCLYDLGIVVSFGHLIPENIISSFPFGMINVHASLLPRWRGAAPIIYAIMHDDRTTGVSIMKIRPKHFDIGDILAQKDTPIEPTERMPELHSKLSQSGAGLLIDCVRRIPFCLDAAKPQSSIGVTYAPKVQSSLGEVNWTTMSAKEIFNLFRALYLFKPITTSWQGTVIKLMDIRLEETTSDSRTGSDRPPGSVEYMKNEKHLKVTCSDGRCIIVNKLGVEGKRLMSAMDFNNGFIRKNKSLSNDLRFHRSTD